MGSDIDVTGRWNASRPSSTSVALRRPPIDLRPHSAIDACFPPCVVCETVAEHSFVSRRDSTFREYPPASAQIAMIVPFYGDLTVWVRKADAAGWHFPSSGRRAGETILEVARRELWDAARIVAPKLDLLGAVRYVLPKQTTSYVYMCESHISRGGTTPPTKTRSPRSGSSRRRRTPSRLTPSSSSSKPLSAAVAPASA